MTRVIGFTGYSNSGKTTVISNLIRIFKERGLNVAVIKHAAHGYEIDTPGKDSWQHYSAGADRVVVMGPDSITSHRRLTERLTLRQIIEDITEPDLILVEGFKQEVNPRILVFRAGEQDDLIFPPGSYKAVISDLELPIEVPRFCFDELEKVADFILDDPSSK
ncbi:molybdopterin-guanine dinucleotide biosynthesis protein mobb [hydrocarbon metagenome]|uniref:Molybdopterin-guanine dinucleotide biosynthesis protein mobb n=1 Tax=hydrocarbon metagenome TaxID=938273 RepID=A0A0W8E5K3_9ZZZZ